MMRSVVSCHPGQIMILCLDWRGGHGRVLHQPPAGPAGGRPPAPGHQGGLRHGQTPGQDQAVTPGEVSSSWLMSLCLYLVWQTHPQSQSQHEDSVSQVRARVSSRVSGVCSRATWPGAQTWRVLHVWGVSGEPGVSSSSSWTPSWSSSWSPSPAPAGSTCARRGRDLSTQLLIFFFILRYNKLYFKLWCNDNLACWNDLQKYIFARKCFVYVNHLFQLWNRRLNIRNHDQKLGSCGLTGRLLTRLSLPGCVPTMKGFHTSDTSSRPCRDLYASDDFISPSLVLSVMFFKAKRNVEMN